MKTTPATLALMLLGGALILYMGVISPLSASRIKAQSELTEEEIQLGAIHMSISQQADIKTLIAQLEKTNEAHRANLMSPMLNSYAMRAKSLLDEMAQEAGLSDVEYDEGEYYALPIPKEQMPKRRTARRTVVMKATADYAAVASFVLRAEKELPFMTVQAISIEGAKGAVANPERQDVTINLEWPCEGEVIK